VSVEAFTLALHHSKATGTAKVVMLGIANHEGTGGSFPKVATLAKYANVDPKNVVRALEKLGELGEIEIDEKAGGTDRTPATQRPNLYKMVLTCPPGCDGTLNHRVDGERISRHYKGERGREKDPVRVARSKAAYERKQAQGGGASAPTPGGASAPPSDTENIKGGGASAPTPGGASAPTPGGASAPTKNHPLNHPREMGSVSTSPAPALRLVENPEPWRDPFAVTEEQAAANARGAALARAALRGSSG
jgi:hypothetical protein